MPTVSQVQDSDSGPAEAGVQNFPVRWRRNSNPRRMKNAPTARNMDRRTHGDTALLPGFTVANPSGIIMKPSSISKKSIASFLVPRPIGRVSCDIVDRRLVMKSAAGIVSGAVDENAGCDRVINGAMLM